MVKYIYKRASTTECSRLNGTIGVQALQNSANSGYRYLQVFQLNGRNSHMYRRHIGTYCTSNKIFGNKQKISNCTTTYRTIWIFPPNSSYTVNGKTSEFSDFFTHYIFPNSNYFPIILHINRSMPKFSYESYFSVFQIFPPKFFIQTEKRLDIFIFIY